MIRLSETPNVVLIGRSGLNGKAQSRRFSIARLRPEGSNLGAPDDRSPLSAPQTFERCSAFLHEFSHPTLLMLL